MGTLVVVGIIWIKVQGIGIRDKGKERQTESIFTQQKIVVDKDKKVIELPRNKENSAYNIEEKIVEKKEESLKSFSMYTTEDIKQNANILT